MGYYDDHSQGRNQKMNRNRGSFLLASIVGAILGAMLVVISIPALSNQGFLPYNVQPNQSQSAGTNDNNQDNFVQQQVSYDVNTNTTKAIDKAADAVVGINNIQTSNFWNDESGDDQGPAGTGSGVVYKKAGDKVYVVTNHHVVEGATQLEVTLNDGTKIPAKLLGSDVWTDLAVLEVDAGKIKKIAEFGDSDALKMGEPVMAIGNPLGATFSGSVTQGIISGINRTIPVDINQDGIMDWQAEVLQTDAAINPGNSGGALINIAGQLIGINSMKIAQNAVEGIGLSIPINYARPIINDLEQYGEVRRPYMGVDLKSVAEIPGYYQEEALKLPREINYGVALRQVVPNSPASQAGLRELDVIVEMDGKTIHDVIDLRKHLYQETKIGDQMEIKYYRDGKLQTTKITLAEDQS
ncbi:trypsin-like peptidase domain-containing protein [Neobacillus sp. 179-C4.2 HS]|uniref:Trypsin-like peptidase domain-containing protein n=1 Tax=Neobacillus driksii TaxID=3035913 RepID=A0ABV4YYG4_9BACI|nr:trypsin-like peptidase domain-containing protein [Neobacillus sp. 179.-C4.2 HS]MDP5194345.1 trypsin-like peptidase domain-containing protein [Neobacillus sp. 179.-C4.2 HS]